MKRRLITAAAATMVTAGIVSVSIVGTAGSASARPFVCEVIEPYFVATYEDVLSTPNHPGTNLHAYFLVNC
ncbi:hypothetical protein I6A84_12165 [Frankia sp. CNm7]|uniref:Secreted protein n=1 Tax=Frankia nepalensis TaxID=1836974 RepID=A0A937UUS7_9ACTN|nr:hypothetical protein [Frankia nepalensis]MBL7495107.1 hypothetical protein [Frankia nepalensis]MBL7515392.1 hypothetical protein [Frankia nepalensis]MBL7518846.1 hypothetical protein [Frankia nepalensis]MBL7632565.1 hypothetical protein [Frankia nepalensis]